MRIAVIVLSIVSIVVVGGCSGAASTPPAKAPDPFAATEVDVVEGNVPLVAADDPPPARPRLSSPVSLGSSSFAVEGRGGASLPQSAPPRPPRGQRDWTNPNLFAEDGNPYAAGVRTGVRPTFTLRSRTSSSAR